MLIVARASRLTFVLLVSLVVVFVVLGARPVESVGAYGPATATANPVSVPHLDDEAAASAPTAVPAAVRAAGLALLAIGGAAMIMTLPRRRTRPERRRAAVGTIKLRV